MKDSIIKEQFFTHSIDKIWNAISKEEEISTWFIKADFKAEKGYKYTFTSSGENCTQITGEVKKADPYTLIYTWVVDGTDVVTTVKWELSSVKGGTQLHLEHSGISMYPGDTAVKMFTSFNGGWDNCLKELAAYAAKGVHA